MGRYLGPRTKIDRKFHDQIFGYSKAFQKKPTIMRKLKKKSRKSEYGELLSSKKKLLYIYNMRERQLSIYVEKATKKREDTEVVLITMLENRLDNVVYRLGLGRTRRACRQLVSHKHICVNGKVVNIASYQVKVGDLITYKEKDKKNKNIAIGGCDGVNVYNWIKWNNEKDAGEIIGVPEKKDVPEKINWRNIIEFYSR
jgi:small subunit ribosomal protein S4